jgi:hypothetical protein
MQVTAGRDDEASSVEAGTFSVVMDDREGNLSPRNVYGDWYGLLGRGTPIRQRWDRTTDDFARTVSPGWGTNTDGFTWSSSNAAFSTDGSRALVQLPINNASRQVLTDAGSLDCEVVWSVTAGTAPTGGAFVSAGLLRHVDVNNYVRAHVELVDDGSIQVKVQTLSDGVLTEPLAATPTGLSYTVGNKVYCRARAEGPYIMVKAWLGSLAAEPVTWNGVAEESELEGYGAGLWFWRINTNVGTYTAYVDDFQLTNTLWAGNVPEWPPRWPEKSGTDSITPIAGAGVMRRIQQGSSPLDSPLRHQLASLSYGVGYWPCEDGSEASAAASGLSGGQSASVTGGTFAGDSTLPGASTSIVLETALTSKITANLHGPVTNGYAALALAKLSVAPGGETLFMDIRATGAAVRWLINITATGINFKGYDNAGTLIADNASIWVIDPTEWFAVQLETNISGGTVTVTLIWHQVGSTTYYSVSDTYSGTAPQLTGFTLQAVTNSMSVGHLWFGDEQLPFVDNTFSSVSNGYLGETASARIARLCAENSVPAVVFSGTSEPMGRQKSAKLIDLLRECERADQGILYERASALVYLPRIRRYNRPVVMELDWSLGHLAEPPEPVDDDQRLRNQWSVSRTDGQQGVTVTDVTGPLGTDRVGLYDDQMELNVRADARLRQFAAWFVKVGTIDVLRWPRIKINLVAHPEFIPRWLGCTIGSRITIANPPGQIAGEVIDLIIEGYTETINVDQWDVELACSPAQPWEVAVYDGTSKRYAARTTTLSADVAAAATTFTLTFTKPGEGWSTRSASQPYDLAIAGEVVRVPVGGMGAITGTGPCTQVVTGATRSINGVSKILPAGSPVQVNSPGRYAL